jgi:hypothetical protein
MISFDLGKRWIQAECSDNDTAEIIVASAVGVAVVALASAGVICHCEQSV